MPSRKEHGIAGVDAYHSSLNVDERQFTPITARQPSLQESMQTPGDNSTTSTASTYTGDGRSPLKLAKSNLAQAPRSELEPRRSKKPSPLQHSDTIYTGPNYKNTSAKASPSSPPAPSEGPSSPRERLEALFASESSSGSRSSSQIFRDKRYETHPHAILRNISAPVLPTSPPDSPKNMLPNRADPRPVMARNHSIDSAVSSISSKTSESARSTPHNPSQDQPNALTTDVGGLITAAGSAELALQKLWKEKQSADSHNAQLWRLVEKQRSMILGLNKDLERAVKDRDRYRKKMKEVAQNPVTIAASNHRSDVASDRNANQLLDPGFVGKPANTQLAAVEIQAVASAPREETSHTPREHVALNLESPPQRAQAADAISIPESNGDHTSIEQSPVTSISHYAVRSRDDSSTPMSRNPHVVNTEFDQDMAKFPMPSSNGVSSPKSPLSPPRTPPPVQPTFSITDATPLLDGGNFSPRSNKLTRKAAPAPLNLAKPTRIAPITILPEPVSTTDSPAKTVKQLEEEEIERGRRRTRQDDDRVREAYAVAQEEARSVSKKSKSSKSKSKSKSKGPTEHPQIIEPVDTTQPEDLSQRFAGLPPSPRATKPPPNLASFLSPSGSESSLSSTAAHRSTFSTPLLSPGLPMSPRPTDRPINAASPRFPKQMMFPVPNAQVPASPRPQIAQSQDRFSVLSPSALPPPLFTRSSPSYNPPSPPEGQAGSDSPAELSSPTSASPELPFPQNVFRGLMSEQFPNLLLPPNALPVIDVKVFSSRLRPSRHSMLLANPSEEDPVFILGISARSNGKQLWRLEKTTFSLSTLHQQIKLLCPFEGKLPERNLFSGHAPAKIDARRAALDAYFDLLLDTPLNERAALVVCGFFSTNVIDAEEDRSKLTVTAPAGNLASTSTAAHPHKEGFLTKRGKNFGGWKARYFILDGPELKYYDSQAGPQIGVIKLVKAQIGKQSPQAANQESSAKEDDADNQYRHAFLILEPKRKDSSSLVRHVLCAESDEERDAWVATLLKYVDYGQEERPQPLPLQAQTQDSSRDSARASVAPESQTSSKQKRRTQQPVVKRSKEPEQSSKESMRNGDSHALGSLDGSTTQGVSYEDTVAGEMPIQGTTVSSFSTTHGMSSPSLSGSMPSLFASQQSLKAPAISGPSNGGVIQNAENWGFKTPVKEKKRSIFGFHRARTPSDAASTQLNANPALLGPDRRVPAPLGRPVFGMPLAEAVEYSQPYGVDVHLPAVVYRCIEYLEAREAASEEGIFRLSGSQNVIKGLRERFNNEGDVRLLDGTYYDVHAVASLLKLYLRELPSSVLTRDLHLDFLKSLEIDQREQKVAAFNVLVHMLPRANLELLSNLCSYLADVANASDVNKMNVRNVAIVFAPTLNIPAPLIQLFLTDYPAIFGEDVPEEKQSPIREQQLAVPPSSSDGIRSPRRQMFSDLPTPAYNQTGFGQQAMLPGFQPLAPNSHVQRNTHDSRPQLSDNGFPAPVVAYAQQPSGSEGNYASLNALSAPSETEKKGRRESSMIGMNYGLINQRQTSRQTLRDTSSSRIPEEGNVSYAQQQRDRDATPERRHQQALYG